MANATLRQVNSGIWAISWTHPDTSSILEWHIKLNGEVIKVLRDPDADYYPVHKLGIATGGTFLIEVVAVGGAGESPVNSLTLNVDPGPIPVAAQNLAFRKIVDVR